MLNGAAVAVLRGGQITEPLPLLVFTDRDEFHLRRHDPLAGIMHLGHVHAGLGAQGLPHMGEPQRRQFRIGRTQAAVLRGHRGQLLDIPAPGDPRQAQGSQPCSHVDLRLRVGIRT